MASDLVAAVSRCRRHDRTVASTLQGRAWITDIIGPKAIPVIAQYMQVREALDGVVLVPGRLNSLIWRWNAAGV
jgi:hypothetical protein